MFAIVARLKVQQDKEDEFVEVMSELARQVREEEDGCLLYQLSKAKEPHLFVMMERYASKEALAEHSKTAHFAKAVARFGPLLDGEPQIEILKEIV